MDSDEFRHWAAKVAEWGAEYHAGIRQRPVRSSRQPGEVASSLPLHPPEEPQPFAEIFADFERLILPGMTHWQHPSFFAYFPANAAPPSILAEMIVANLAAQCMIWQTSPAAAELEGVVLKWFAEAIGLPPTFTGVIQDTASSATLAAVLTMRERALAWVGNRQGISGQPRVRIYASNEVHSSIDRAIWISGVGQDNLVRIPVLGDYRGLDTEALETAIRRDLETGNIPAGVIICVGSTSCGSTDHVAETIRIAQKYDLFTHVDAAWAGSAMICPEFRHWWSGIENADSIVINPHKWLGAQFDCSTHFLRDPKPVLRTLAIHPEYLKTFDRDGHVDYSEMTIQLGRRFRALKLWFLVRTYGLEGLRNRIRNHVMWSENLARWLGNEPDFQIINQPMLSLFTFRFSPLDYQGDLADLNQRLLTTINDSGKLYLSSTKIDGEFLLRFQVGQFETTEQDVRQAGDAIARAARGLKR